MIHFKEVNKENFKDIIGLKLRDDQKGFLENNLYSMAESKVNDHLVPRGIYCDDQLIGFMLYYFSEGNPDYVYLKRLMLDEAWQGKGLGRSSMDEAIQYFKAQYPSIGCVELMHYPDNTVGAALYESLGFTATGEIRETEIVRRRYY